MIDAVRALERRLTERMAANPLESLALVVGLGALVMHAAESRRNPKMRTYWDAFHYMATSLSVGYAPSFPQTEFGKALGGLVQIFGPALSSRVLAGAEPPHPPDVAVVERLDAILDELRRMRKEGA